MASTATLALVACLALLSSFAMGHGSSQGSLPGSLPPVNPAVNVAGQSASNQNYGAVASNQPVTVNKGTGGLGALNVEPNIADGNAASVGQASNQANNNAAGGGVVNRQGAASLVGLVGRHLLTDGGGTTTTGPTTTGPTTTGPTTTGPSHSAGPVIPAVNIAGQSASNTNVGASGSNAPFTVNKGTGFGGTAVNSEPIVASGNAASVGQASNEVNNNAAGGGIVNRQGAASLVGLVGRRLLATAA